MTKKLTIKEQIQAQRRESKAPAKPITRELPEPVVEQASVQSASPISNIRDRLPSRKKIKRWTIGIAILSTLGLSGYKGFEWHKSKKEKEANELKIKKEKVKRNGRILAIIAKMKACKNEKSLKNLCLPKTKIDLLKSSAEMDKQTEDYVKAGKIYAQLVEVTLAKRMIDLCVKKNDFRGAEEIRNEMRIVSESIKRFSMGK